MAGEGIQNYVDMAAGLTKATRAKARAAAKSLLATAGLEDVAADATDRATRLAEEVLAASKANRELMNKLVASEVDKAAARLGFVRADELEELRREMTELRMSMAHAAAQDAPESATGSTTGRFGPDLGIPDPPSPVETLVEPDEAPTIEPIEDPVVGSATAVKRAAAKKAAKTASVQQAPAKRTSAKKAPAKKAPAKKAAAKKAPSEQAAVTAPAKKAASRTSVANTAASAPETAGQGSDAAAASDTGQS